jgi:hypothetical protein
MPLPIPFEVLGFPLTCSFSFSALVTTVRIAIGGDSECWFIKLADTASSSFAFSSLPASERKQSTEASDSGSLSSSSPFPPSLLQKIRARAYEQSMENTRFTNTQLLETTKTKKAFTVVSRGMNSASDCKRRSFLKRNKFKPLWRNIHNVT